jgi:hypothetical protein
MLSSTDQAVSLPIDDAILSVIRRGDMGCGVILPKCRVSLQMQRSGWQYVVAAGPVEYEKGTDWPGRST